MHRIYVCAYICTSSQVSWAELSPAQPSSALECFFDKCTATCRATLKLCTCGISSHNDTSVCASCTRRACNCTCNAYVHVRGSQTWKPSDARNMTQVCMKQVCTAHCTSRAEASAFVCVARSKPLLQSYHQDVVKKALGPRVSLECSAGQTHKTPARAWGPPTAILPQCNGLILLMQWPHNKPCLEQGPLLQPATCLPTAQYCKASGCSQARASGITAQTLKSLDRRVVTMATIDYVYIYASALRDL